MTETILGIDTSTVVSVGLARDGAIIEHCAVGDSRSHLEQLVPTIQAVLERAGLTTANLTGVAVGMGPGPFTGLRAGIAAAEMLAYVHQIPLIRVCSLDILGLSWAGTAPEGDFVGCTDARRKELYWAVYDAQGHRQSGPFVSTPTALPNLPRIGPGVPDHGSGQSSGQRDGDASREQNKFTCSAEAKETVDERSEEHGSTGQRDGSAVSPSQNGVLPLFHATDVGSSPPSTRAERDRYLGIDAGLLAQRAYDFVTVGPNPLYLRSPDATVGAKVKSVIPEPRNAGLTRGDSRTVPFGGTVPFGSGLRRARVADLGGIMALEKAGFARPWSLQSWVSELDHQVWVVGSGEEVEAVVAMSLVSPTAELRNVIVRGDRQGQGWGRYLVEHGLAWAEEAGATEVFLEVSVQNLKAIRLYERVGFTRIDQRLDYYGPGDDALVMRWQPASGTGVSDV